MNDGAHEVRLATDPAVPAVVLLAEPCWWIDRNDCWETPHYPTREDAEADHTDQVRSDHGWPLSFEGAIAIVYGQARRERHRCREWICPDCGCHAHSQERNAWCPDECGFEFVIKEIAPDERDQERLFELPPLSTPAANDVLPTEKGDLA